MHILLAIFAAILLLPSLWLSFGIGLCSVCDAEWSGHE